MITFKQKGNFKNTEKFLSRVKKMNIRRILDAYGQEGVRVLANATPVDSGLTAVSWGYEISISKGSSSIIWTNSNVQKGVPIALILQLGHGTGTGGYVQGIDYINPALKPIFESMANAAWQEVTRG